ncbi:MAG: T9SS type A sorting domain-containing protein [Candidatus Pseudobacter hemicellulosilyticus]|uniref:T9SS type A sorting domain-containing protein n=1 Tax=Candidatus Pseudobacter hemicellulosilyticus TaxID=3121375 RepID=A0AAJ5WPI1_9BACT|nr:MAG: T9SS type A sorting domain-containing protein [Pseudobacter sp.]
MHPSVRSTTFTAVRLVTLTTLSWFTAQAPASAASPAPERPVEDTIVVRKQVTHKKYRVNLYPNASHEQLFFHAAGREGKVYHLYLFDVEGKLVRQALVTNEQTTVLRSLEKGNYSYEVFSNDERISNGQLIKK